MGGADDKLMDPKQAAYAVGAVRMRRTHIRATNKHKRLGAPDATFAHAGKPDLLEQGRK